MQRLVLRKFITAAQASEEATRKFWNTMSDFYEKYNVEPSKKNYEAMSPFLSLNSCSTLLDAGCGSGYGLPIMKAATKNTLKVSMLDISDENVQKVVKRYADATDVKRGNAESLPYKSNTFDAYVANGLLEIVDNPEWVVSEAFRVLKPGGKAAFSLYGRMGICNILRIYKVISNTLRLDKGTFSAKFELSEPEKVVALFKNVGFTNFLHFYEQYHYPQLNVNDLIGMYWENPILQEEAKAKKKSKHLEEVIKEELNQIIQVTKEPLILESLIFVATKP